MFSFSLMFFYFKYLNFYKSFSLFLRVFVNGKRVVFQTSPGSSNLLARLGEWLSGLRSWF